MKQRFQTENLLKPVFRVRGNLANLLNLKVTGSLSACLTSAVTASSAAATSLQRWHRHAARRVRKRLVRALFGSLTQNFRAQPLDGTVSPTPFLDVTQVLIDLYLLLSGPGSVDPIANMET